MEAAKMKDLTIDGMTEAKAMQWLISPNNSERFDAAVALDRKREGLSDDQRRQLIGKLMAILSSTNSDEAKVYAVVVLGEYQASEAVPMLVRHFEWDEKDTYNGGSDYRKRVARDLVRPVTHALFNIGHPAVPALLNRIQETMDSNAMERCVRICRAIEGPEVTQFRLQGLIENATDYTKRERLQFALDILKNLGTPK